MGRDDDRLNAEALKGSTTIDHLLRIAHEHGPHELHNAVCDLAEAEAKGALFSLSLTMTQTIREHAAERVTAQQAKLN